MRVQIKLWRLLVAASMMVLGGKLAVGCGGPRGGTICDSRCDCEGCSIAGYDGCLDEADADEIISDRRGCYALYDDFVACEEVTGFCERGREFRTDCGVERDRWRRCVD